MNVSAANLMAHSYVQYIKDKTAIAFGPSQRKVALIGFVIIAGIGVCYCIYRLYSKQKKVRKVNEKHNAPQQHVQKQEEINKKAHSIIDFKQKEQKQEDKGYAFRHKRGIKLDEEKPVQLRPVPQTPPRATDARADIALEKPVEEVKEEPKQEEKVDSTPQREPEKLVEEEHVLIDSAPQTLPRTTDAEADIEPEKTDEEAPQQEESLDSAPQQEQEAEFIVPVVNQQEQIGVKKLTIRERLEKNLEAARKQQESEVLMANFKIVEGEIPERIIGKPLEGRKETVNGREVGVASCEGYRRGMEDAELTTSIEFIIQGQSYKGELFGVFDGHSDKQASQYVKDHLVEYLTIALQKAVGHGETLTEEHIFKALKTCCQELDQAYATTNNRDGTTVTFALILEGKIWVANVGDSRTVLSNNQVAYQLTEDAEPQIDRYKKKIEKLGGWVMETPAVSRVNGTLGVGRAIGDHSYQKDGKKCVVPNPKISCYALDQITNGYLILSCDGVYESSTTNQIVAALNERVEKEESIDVIAKRLVLSVIDSGSEDNVSMVIVKL